MSILIKHIIIHAAFLIICVNVSVAQLVISSGSSITIKDGTSLYVGTNMYLESDANGSGHLADQNTTGNCIITGTKTVERYLSANGWHNTSSPVINTNSSVYTGTDLIFYYDETIILNDWNFGWVWHDGPLSIMKGYDIFSESSFTTNYTATTSESLNTGNYNIAITRTNVTNGEIENRKGWNLIGNPYPSPIDWLMESGWDKADINDAKYIWSPTNNNYTIFLGGSTPTGINGGTQYIPSNQGFWVQAAQNGNISVNNSARVGLMPSTPNYYKNGATISQELRLFTTGNGYTDETMIRFIPESTHEFDLNKDACKLLSNHDSVPQLSTLSGKTMLAINSLPEITHGLAIQLNFSCNTSGYYTIAIDDTSTINSAASIYLKDIREQKIINLNNAKKYKFYHNSTNNRSRFKVYFNPSEDIINNIEPDSYFTVSSSKNKLSIIRNTTELHNGQVNIYNIVGQKIKSFNISNNTTTNIVLNITTGYYIVSIITNNHIANSKIWLHN